MYLNTYRSLSEIILRANGSNSIMFEKVAGRNYTQDGFITIVCVSQVNTTRAPYDNKTPIKNVYVYK